MSWTFLLEACAKFTELKPIMGDFDYWDDSLKENF